MPLYNILCDLGSIDTVWCRDVVKRINGDLLMSGCYDELQYQTRTGRRAGNVFITTFTKDHINIPPRVRIEDREEAEESLEHLPTQEEEEEGRVCSRAEDEWPEEDEFPGQGGGVESDTRKGRFIQSRLNLPSLYTRSICQHACMRLVTVDKTGMRGRKASTQLSTNRSHFSTSSGATFASGFSAYIFEAT